MGVLNHFDNKDAADDVTKRGAFAKSLQRLIESGRKLVVLWQHDPNKPIGVWENLRETSRGLEGEAHLNLDVAQAREAFALAKQGALTGISIGYYVIDEYFDASTNTNYLRELDLIETSLVTFPCNDLSRTEGIKMKLKNNKLPTVAELTVFLQEKGLSSVDAKAITAKYMPDHKTPEEKAAEDAAYQAERAEAEKTIRGLSERFGFKFEVEPEGKTEDEPEGEKSKSIDAFFK